MKLKADNIDGLNIWYWISPEGIPLSPLFNTEEEAQEWADEA